MVNEKLPKTVDEAAEFVMAVLSDKDKNTIRGAEYYLGLTQFHHGLGTFIRNKCGLWHNTNKELLEACGGESVPPDSASAIIINRVWQKLNNYSDQFMEDLRPEPLSESELLKIMEIHKVWKAEQAELVACEKAEQEALEILEHHHQNPKRLRAEFIFVWEMLSERVKKPFLTPNGHSFFASAVLVTKGVRRGEKIVLIERDGGELSSIYPCCWKHANNCDGTYIDDCNDALIKWLDIEPGDIYPGT